ncbi:chemotaxis response regulator protein-glutamate methylesterase [Methylocaldum sp.]|uniref:protein-glutamate methylesterase/protein-glutamine glutaminase n=1 Tax=Methylocaldum sp. TaxID=1969727 RepID=UPI002D546352|nr:chemotaxis response regulator protein-glutamate methylesterase [Methylocaldum sp.]HYE36753.1 chemotaxis response regulator protein-glutamate methylesterase [Methylocaldum sp.]
MKKISVMLVDDSAVVRQVIGDILSQDPAIELIGAASDPIFAMERMKRRWPDVIVLDVEMPRMDGITFLKKLMAEHPTPVVICSSLTEKGAETTMQALSSGAVGIIAKAKLGIKQHLQNIAAELTHAVKSAALANVKRLRPPAETLRKMEPKLTADAVLSVAHRPLAQTTDKVVALGASTGGTQALEAVLTSLPRVCPGIVVVQHMPEKFTTAFADRLDRLSSVEVKEAANGDRVLPGRALIAPGGRHMLLKRSGALYYVDVVDGPLVNRHCPSVDVLFRSVANAAGKNAFGVIMTGMGDDGARGLKEMREAGGLTLAQDEETCVVYGMPKEAVKLGAAERSIALEDIPAAILDYGASR